MRLLIIEDDRDSADYLVKAFREVGHVAEHAADGEQGLALASSGDYDILIVDRMLPKRDGLSVIGTLREKGVETPALILSALGQVDDRIKGLRAGGDDYLTKPFDPDEMTARIEVLLRRRQAQPQQSETTLSVGPLQIDLIARTVKRDGEDISLLPTEYRLLEYLMRHAGQTITRTMLFEAVWGYHFDPGTNLIDVHMGRLRKKIDPPGTQPLIQTVRGSGYLLGQ